MPNQRSNLSALRTRARRLGYCIETTVGGRHRVYWLRPTTADGGEEMLTSMDHLERAINILETQQEQE